MDKVINLRLLARPGNWFKVFLMVAIVLFGIKMVTGSGSSSAMSVPANPGS